MAEFPIHGRFLFSVLLRHQILEDGREPTSGYAVHVRRLDLYGDEEKVAKWLSDHAQQIRRAAIERWKSTKVARNFEIEIVSHSLTKLSD